MKKLNLWIKKFRDTYLLKNNSMINIVTVTVAIYRFNETNLKLNEVGISISPATYFLQ